MATANGEAEAERFYATAERQKTQITARISQLDNIIRCLYEDRVTGRITPELLRVFIRRIEVYEKAEKYSRTCGNRIVIHYMFQAGSGQRADAVADEASEMALLPA